MIAKQFIQETESKMKKSVESARREFSEVRTGRAHPGLIEGLHVEYYGKPTMFKEVASITVPDPRTVVIQPWDPTVIPEIEKAILNSKLGINPTIDGKLVRLNIPPLSDERRQELIKVVKDMAEKAKVSLRSIRRESNDKIKKMQSDKQVSEDESFKAQESIQKLTDKYIKEVDVLLEEKSKALMS
ncbi:MAG: ribosome recycling factor [Candidatus Omnitrophica bacterium]|nr:ribosome recycling factor [Candidatus Omnitrophota bacterium]